MNEIIHRTLTPVSMPEEGENRSNAIYRKIAELQIEVTKADEDGRLTLHEVSCILIKLSDLTALLNGHVARLVDAPGEMKA